MNPQDLLACEDVKRAHPEVGVPRAVLMLVEWVVVLGVWKLFGVKH